MKMDRRGFIARLFAAPIVALALLKAPMLKPHTTGSFGDEPIVNNEPYDIEELRRRYIDPAVRAMVDRHDAALMEMVSR